MVADKRFSRFSRKAESDAPRVCYHCPNNAKSRGLCVSCLAAANRKVKNGEVTWEQLEKMGLCEVKPKIPFIAALEAELAVTKAKQAAAKKAAKATATKATTKKSTTRR